MSVLTVRGGVAAVRRVAVDGTGRRYTLPFTTLFLQVRNVGANPLRVFVTAEDFAADVDFVSIAAGSAWEGPAELGDVWLKGDGGNTTAEVVAYQRRG